MTNHSVKRGGELLKGVFQILAKEPNGLPAKEVLRKLEVQVPPTPFEAEDYPKHPGVRRYEKVVRFNTVASVKAGWLEKSKGIWTLTEAGKEILSKFSNPEELQREAGRRYRNWRKTTQSNGESAEGDDLDAATAAGITFERADEDAWSEIENHIKEMDAYDFQNKMVPGLLKAMGYHVTWKAPPGADGGIDLVAYPDPLGAKEPTIKVSVRHRVDQKADVKDLREFLSRINPSEVGIFVSLGGFTRDAERECRTEQRRIRLIDLERLFDLWTEFYTKIPEADRKLLPLKPVHFLALETEEQ